MATQPRSGRIELEHPTETRPAVRTTEFFAFLASVVLVIIVGYSGDDSLDTRTIWTLVTILTSAYMVSRGIAKAGTYERRSDIDVNTRQSQGRWLERTGHAYPCSPFTLGAGPYRSL